MDEYTWQEIAQIVGIVCVWIAIIFCLFGGAHHSLMMFGWIKCF